MRFKLSTVRNFKIIAGAALCLAILPSAGHAFTYEDQKRLCSGDAMRLCGSEIPNVERITACMVRQRENLSPGCRSVFGKASGSHHRRRHRRER
jgi:hypothetical protein